jgi:hypothetical protein
VFIASTPGHTAGKSGPNWMDWISPHQVLIGGYRVASAEKLSCRQAFEKQLSGGAAAAPSRVTRWVGEKSRPKDGPTNLYVQINTYLSQWKKASQTFALLLWLPKNCPK